MRFCSLFWLSYKFFERYWFVVQGFSLVCYFVNVHLHLYGEQNLSWNVYFNSKLKVTCKNEGFEYQCIKTHFDKESLKFVLFQSSFCFFFHQNSLTNLPSWVVRSPLFMINHQTRFKVVHSSLAQITQNLEFINLKHVSYTQPIWVS